MPTVKKIDASLFNGAPKGNGARKAIEQEYDTLLAEFLPYEYGRAELEEGDVKSNVRNRIRAAALRRGLLVEFRRTKEEAVIFKLLPNEEEEAVPYRHPHFQGSEPLLQEEPQF